MSALVLVGTQWGDEGKGKVTDFLTAKADMVVRYQGGKQCRAHSCSKWPGAKVTFNSFRHLIPR